MAVEAITDAFRRSPVRLAYVGGRRALEALAPAHLGQFALSGANSRHAPDFKTTFPDCVHWCDGEPGRLFLDLAANALRGVP